MGAMQYELPIFIVHKCLSICLSFSIEHYFLTWIHAINDKKTKRGVSISRTTEMNWFETLPCGIILKELLNFCVAIEWISISRNFH